jgi:formylglycine-generating enzyme required for sulfatase activity
MPAGGGPCCPLRPSGRKLRVGTQPPPALRVSPSQAGGTERGRKRRYPWGDQFDKNKCNTDESGIKGTTQVRKYSPVGDSPYGLADMAGNVWEWTSSLYSPYPYNANDGREDLEAKGGRRVLRGGSFHFNVRSARCSYRSNGGVPDRDWHDGGCWVCWCAAL